MLGVVVTASASLLAAVFSSPAYAATNVDLRGTFSVVSIDNGVSYPQTWNITSEDLQTGAFSGADFNSTLSLSLTGVVHGTSFTSDTAGAGYTSSGTGGVTGSAGTYQVTGTFTDSNNTTGTFTGAQTSTVSPNGSSTTSSSIPTTSTTTPPTNIVGGLNLAAYCQSRGYSSVRLVKGAINGPNFAYANWACVTQSGTSVLVATVGNARPSEDDACNFQYPGRPVHARPTSLNDAYSWRCLTGVDPITAATTSTPLGSNPSRSTIAASLATPSDAFASASHTVVNAVIAAAVVLFIAFPSQLFNHTFQENYEEIAVWWRKKLKNRRLLRRWLLGEEPDDAPKAVPSEGGSVRVPESGGTLLVAPADQAPVQADAAVALAVAKPVVDEKFRIGKPPPKVLVVIALGAIFGIYLDPRAGLNSASITSFIAICGSTVLGMIVPAFVIHRYRKIKERGTTFALTAIPTGLLIALVCVIVSRIAAFQPGYLYGVICGVSFATALNKREQGHTVTLATLTTVAIAIIAWLLWIPVNHAAAHSGALWPVVLADDFLASVFTGGIVGATIGSFPLRFLPGGTVAAWHKGVWAAVATLVTFIFVAVILNPSRGGHAGHAPLVTAIVLLVVFGGGSVYFYEHFNRKKHVASEST